MKQAGSKKGVIEQIRMVLGELKNSDWWIRKETIGKLLDYPEDLYLADIEGWLRNGEDALLRNAAMEIYKELGERALGSLVFLLGDEDSDVRIFSANVLGDIRDSAALGALVEALQDPDANVKIAVAEALGKIGDERAVPPLAAVLGDMPWTAMAAIEAFGKIGGQAALSALHECLEHEEYRGMACAALELAGDESSIGLLVPLLACEDAGEQALQAIVSIAEREKARLPALLFSRNSDRLTEWASSPRDAVRRAAFIVLGRSQDIRGLPYFLKGLHDDLLQEHALNGLLSVGKPAVPEIVEALKQPGKNKGILAKVLTMLGEEERLLCFVNDEDDEVRTEAALAIGSLKTPEAEEALQALSRDRSEEVRAAALLSLRNSER